MANDTEKRITAKMVLDSTGYNDKLKGLNSEMKKHQSELKLASEGIKTFGKDSEKLKSVQESLSKQVELHSKKVDLYKQSIEKATSKMQDNIKERDKLKSSLESVNKKYDEAVKLYGKESNEARKAKEEVDRLKSEHEKASKAVESNAKQVQGYETNLNKANAEMVKAKGNLNKVNDELSKSNNKWLNASDKLKDHSEKLKKTGSAVSGVGDEMLKLSVPIAAAGLASAKLGTDFNEAMSKVATLIPGNQKRLQELKGDVQDVSIEVGKDTNDIADGTYQVISAFGDASDTMQKVKIDAKAATAGMATTTDALNLSSAVMKGYGDTSAEANQKIMDMSFNVVKLGQTDFPSLAASIGKVVPLSNELKITQEEMFTVFATGTGVTGNASEVATQYRGILQSLMAPTKGMSKLIEEQGFKDGKAMIAKKGLAGTIELITKKAKETNTPLQQYIGSIEGQTLALALAGEQSNVYKDKLEQMKNSAGALDEAFNEQTNGINKTGFAYKQAMIKMQVAGQKMGDAMAPILEKGAELLTKLADKLGNLSKEQLESIAKWGMLSIATGGALKVVGGGISTIGNITGGLSKLTGFLGKAKLATEGASVATGLATKGISAMGLVTKAGALLLNPWVLGIGAAAAGGLLLAKNLKKDAVPAVDLFADKVEHTTERVKNASGEIENKMVSTTTKISQGTKKAVGAYMNLDKQATNSITNMYVNMNALTDKNTKDLVGTYAEMNTQIKSGLDKHYKERVSDLQEFFKANNALTDEEKAQILQKEKQANDERKASQDEYCKMIQNILAQASRDKRVLTADEVKEINGYQEQMRKNAVESLSNEEVECKVIMERLKSNTERLTAEQASTVIANAEKQRQESVKKAEDQHDKTVANIIRMRDETHSITAEQADKMIKEADRQRDQSINKAQLMKDGVVNQIKRMNGDVLKDINTSDGSIKDRWTKLKEWFSNNPIMRTIKSVVQGSQAELEAGHNWTGTNYWKGGLTYLHDAPGRNPRYELYDLPRGTRVYNHDASQELVMKTAEDVASKVANSVLKNFEGLGAAGQEQTIIIPVQLDGREIARVTARPMSEELSRLNKRGGLGYV